MGAPVIPLAGRSRTSNWRPPRTDIWRVVDGSDRFSPDAAVRVRDGRAPDGAGLYLASGPAAGPGPTIHLPERLGHLDVGDVIAISEDGARVSVVWKSTAVHNSLLLTERCDNYCIMCSQPPKDRDDSFLYARARRIVDALPPTASSIAFTGGEPTVDASEFLGLLNHVAAVAPHLSVHVLSNGRRFGDRDFTARYAAVALRDLMVGIPVYGSEPSLHDFVVQAPGAFNETIKGILTLAENGCRIELRVVVQQATVPALAEIAHYIARNLPFVDQVALMGLEMTGLAKPNASLVWIDPFDYREQLREAYEILASAHIRTRIYNHQLCVLDQALWPAAVQSISEWKNNFPELCEPCIMRDACAGVFTTSGQRLSSHLAPITEAF